MERPTYRQLVESLFFDVMVWKCVGDYQGDYLIVVKDAFNHYYYDDDDEVKWGFLVIGYGSCSGCDTLQAAETLKEIYKLRESILQRIKWFNSKSELKEYVQGKDFEVEWYWSSDEEAVKDFAEAVNTL